MIGYLGEMAMKSEDKLVAHWRPVSPSYAPEDLFWSISLGYGERIDTTYHSPSAEEEAAEAAREAGLL